MINHEPYYIEFNVTVTDTKGAFSNAEMRFNADCTNLPQHWIVDSPSGGSVAFGMFASLFDSQDEQWDRNSFLGTLRIELGQRGTDFINKY